MVYGTNVAPGLGVVADTYKAGAINADDACPVARLGRGLYGSFGRADVFVISAACSR
jgi:hypothetical protein